ncbi:phage tail sheath family protein [Neolewinella persica]|uniref:phage tail sheath family protein n=1 Tax=Neolewinella persica TaxID=70998 RepID=UPI00036FA805|nr:phage tail sheath C-terminal domain-containing protein [Neolewinella persica]
MANYRAPGVYVEEISSFPPSVVAVETAIPAFIGYTARRPGPPLAAGVNAADPVRIGSLLEFEELFGRGLAPAITRIDLDDNHQFVRASLDQTFYLYPALQLFYANGGGDCYIVSVGDALAAGDAPDATELQDGIAVLETWDEPTILLMPDAVSLIPAVGDPHPMYGLANLMLTHCQTLMDRVAVIDLPEDAVDGADFRTNTGTAGLAYGAAYTPWLNAALAKPYNADILDANANIFVGAAAGAGVSLEDAVPPDEQVLVQAAVANGPDSLEATTLFQESPTYRSILRGLNATALPMPPSGAVAGLYAFVDRTRGVWKAPANVSVSGIQSVTDVFTHTELGNLNVDAISGKSINAIRHFTGKGILVFGARTLAGNDGDYKYISVRRLMNMLEESIKKATEQFVFEPNTANTWTRVQSMIENFLTLLWRDGGLQGAKQEHAFRVAVGLGRTMTPQDVIDGRMIVEIAVAPVRPAEFIVLRFMQHLPNS